MGENNLEESFTERFGTKEGWKRRSPVMSRETERVGKKQRMRGRRKGAVTAEMVYEEGH
jgi:hypothetical protein